LNVLAIVCNHELKEWDICWIKSFGAVTSISWTSSQTNWISSSSPPTCKISLHLSISHSPWTASSNRALMASFVLSRHRSRQPSWWWSLSEDGFLLNHSTKSSLLIGASSNSGGASWSPTHPALPIQYGNSSCWSGSNFHFGYFWVNASSFLEATSPKVPPDDCILASKCHISRSVISINSSSSRCSLNIFLGGPSRIACSRIALLSLVIIGDKYTNRRQSSRCVSIDQSHQQSSLISQSITLSWLIASPCAAANIARRLKIG